MDATTIEQLAGERYITLTTFRRSGYAVHTAVWHVVVDGALYVHTGDQTGKAKRLRANGKAEIARPTPVAASPANRFRWWARHSTARTRSGSSRRSATSTDGSTGQWVRPRDSAGRRSVSRPTSASTSTTQTGKDPVLTANHVGRSNQHHERKPDMTTEAPASATRVVDGREVPVAGTWTLDPTHTILTFEARHMMISKVRGAFGSAAGTIEVAENPTQSTVDVTIDAASVESGTEDRDNHLRSPDFFDVENHPEIVFKGTGVEVTDDGYQINGELTVKDVTRPVTLDFEFTGGLIDPYGNARVAFSATTEVDREDWDLTWNMPLETGGFLVGKKIKLFVDTEATLNT